MKRPPRAWQSPKKFLPAVLREAERVTALRALGLLDTISEPCFDRLTRAAAHVFRAPFAFLTLIDEQRVFFKSCYGVQLTELPRTLTFCNHTVGCGDVLVIPDAAGDPQFARNPFVRGAPSLRFYAGAPLITSDGLPIGTICVLDIVPHAPPSESELVLLRDLADTAVDCIEHRFIQRVLAAHAEALERRDREFREGQALERHFRDDTRDVHVKGYSAQGA